MGSDAAGRSEVEQLALLVDGALDYASVVLGPEGTIRTWNAGAERITGYARGDIVGRSFSVLYTEADTVRGHPAEELRLAERHGRYEEEGWRVRQDGTRFWANTIIAPLHDAGVLVGFGKVMRDVTARHLEEEQDRARSFELETANRQLAEFRRLVSSVRDYAIFMLDPDGHILSWNTGAEHLKGYTRDEIVGRHFSTFYTEADRARDHPAGELEIATSEGRYEEEGWRVRKDGTMFWAGVTITAVRDEDGLLTGFAKVTRDLSERRAAEEALHEAIDELRRANHELDRFASIAAHDMTDPLRTIAGFAEILERAELPREQAVQYAGHIRSSSARLGEMLQALLSYSRAGRADVPAEPVALAPATARVLADLTSGVAERGAEVTVDVPAEAAVLATAPDVEVLLQNLVGNALKFGDAERPSVRVSAAGPEHGAWRVTVADNGVGIAPDDQERIFAAFERAAAGADRPGYGLGLAICQRLVDRHGGRIGVDSEPGRGTRVWFTLPAALPVP
ncbi:MAG: PAS domain-containing sensor histidine kinase [Solirubrobacteraceae bacterium]